MAVILKAGSVAVQIIGLDQEFQKAMNRSTKTIDRFTSKFKDLFVTTAAMRQTFQGALQPLTQMFSVFSSFEMGMSKVKAITGATADEIGRLREQAKELGKTTFFTASQVADAQKFLAMAGFNPKQILDAIPDVLNLSLAGDMDLGMAADIATNISTPFKIAAKNLSLVNDILAKSATSSNTNVQELGQAFKYAAPAAAAAGQSIEECGAAMSILANNGIKADMAGTSIRMMLIKLADSGIQNKLKEQFDIDVTDIAGNMRPLLSILEELKAKTNDLGQTSQMSAFYDIFEARAGTAAVVLGNAGDAIVDFRLKMSDAAGTAADMAKTMSDNIKGDWIALMSAVEGTQIAFGDAVNQMSRGWLQFSTTFTRGVTGFIAGHQNLISTTIKLSAAYAGLKIGVAVLSGLRPMLASLIPVSATSVQMEQLRAVTTGKTMSAINAETAAINANSTAQRTNAAIQKQAFFDAKAKAIIDAKTKAIIAETAATEANIKAKTQAMTADIAAQRKAIFTQTHLANTSLAGKIGNVNNNISTLSGKRNNLTAQLATITTEKTAWQKELQNANAKAIKGSTVAQKEAALIQKEINILKSREVAINQEIAATNTKIAAAESRRVALTNSSVAANARLSNTLNELAKQQTAAMTAQKAALAASAKTRLTNYLGVANQAGSIAAFRAEQSAMAATAVARRNYLNQLGLMNVGLNKSAAAVMVMSNADLVAIYRKRLLMTAITQNIVVTKAATAASYASAVATKALAWSYLSAGAAIKAHPIMFSAALVAGMVAATIAISKFREKVVELHDEMSKQRETGDQSRTVDDKKMQRLQQLASQQKLSNSEMKEAETLSGQLEGKYGDFGVTIDKTTNSINLAADAMQRFMESMNAKALQDLENELKEGEKNFQELQKEINSKAPGMMGAISGVFDWRNSRLNTGFGYSKEGLLGDTTEKQMRELGEKQIDQMKKNAEIRKKINALKGGGNALDVAKDESALLDEKISEGGDNETTKSLKEAEKKIAEMQRSIERDRKTSLENEIADLKERNEEYKKYLKMLIEAEMAKKPENINWTNYNNWNEQLTNADDSLNQDIDRLLDKRMEGYQKMIDQAGMSDFEKELANARAQARKDYEEGAKIIDAKIAQLDPTKDVGEIARLNAQKNALGEIEQNEVQKIYDKAKVDSDKLALSPMEKAVSDKMALRDAAVETGDLDKIKKAQKELEKAKRELEMTSFKRVQAALTNARTEYEQALEAFNNAKEGDEKAIAGNKLNEAEKKLDEIESRYDGMSEKQYNDKIKNLTDNVRKEALGEMFKSSGTFSAFELGNLDNSVAKEQLDELRIIGKEVKEIKRKKLNSPKFK